MSIEFAILGLLSFSPFSGYDIKKIFEDSPALYWSGNNNQIYNTLVAMHKKGWVTREVQPQELHPPRKVYAITALGSAELNRWILTTPELPQLRHAFFLQLTWSANLPPGELDALLEEYENEVWMQATQFDRQIQAGSSQDRARPLPGMDPSMARSRREARLWSSLQAYWRSYFENELAWVRKLRKELIEN